MAEHGLAPEEVELNMSRGLELMGNKCQEFVYVNIWQVVTHNSNYKCSICFAKLAIGELGEKYVVLFATVSSPKLTMTKRMTTESSPDLANFAIKTRQLRWRERHFQLQIKIQHVLIDFKIFCTSYNHIKSSRKI